MNEKVTKTQADLQKRISQLCEMATEMNELIETRECYLNVPDEFETKEEWIEAKEAKYEKLFSETVEIYGQ